MLDKKYAFKYIKYKIKLIPKKGLIWNGKTVGSFTTKL